MWTLNFNQQLKTKAEYFLILRLIHPKIFCFCLTEFIAKQGAFNLFDDRMATGQVLSDTDVKGFFVQIDGAFLIPKRVCNFQLLIPLPPLSTDLY